MALLDAVAVTFWSSIVLGSLYALMAMGLTLIYATLRILNFAHGAFYMWGPFILWWLIAEKTTIDPNPSGLMLPFFAAFPVAVGAIFAIGVLTERALIRTLINRPLPALTTLVVTIGLAIFLQGGATLTFGHQIKAIQPIATGGVKLGGITLANVEIAQFAIAIGVLILMQLFLKKTRHGLAIRATAQDTMVASWCGVKISRVYLLVFGIGAMLASISGILLSNIIFIHAGIGTLPMVKAFIIIIFGGIGNIFGTIVAAYLLAFTEQYTALFADSSFSLTAAFALMVLVLAFRPQGLFGFKEQ